jgi:threonylcarbamoyladenosine tRNA methylthiotransferase MtaB
MLRCSYCIIPQVRPHVHSRPVKHIVEEVQRLVANGYREIVLTGVHLGHYGVEGNWNKPKEEWNRLSHLVRRLAELPGAFRLRLSSIEATEVTRELIGVMADHPERIAPHLHICLQSGSDAVLRRMRRRWGTRLFLDRCRLVRESLDNPAITTDVIIGFPGESQADFQATLDTCRAADFSKIHSFPFSPRKGTPAAEMPDRISGDVQAERSHRLSELEAELRRQYFQSLVGHTERVLVEGPSETTPGRMVGTSGRYAPVELAADDVEVGSLTPVVLDEVAGNAIIGRLAPANYSR